MWAAKKGHIDVVNMLVQAHSNIEKCDAKGHTVLMQVALAGKTEVVQTLIRGGARIEARDPNGATSLILAIVIKNQTGVIEALKDAAADKTYANEFIGRRFLAQLWGIEGTSVYTHEEEKDQHQIENTTFKLELNFCKDS